MVVEGEEQDPPPVYSAGRAALGPGIVPGLPISVESEAHFSRNWNDLISEKRMVWVVPSVNSAILRARLTPKALRGGVPAYGSEPPGRLKMYQSPSFEP